MSFFGAKTPKQAASQPAYTGLQIQTSANGKCLPLVCGTTKIAPNLIWCGGFYAEKQTTSGQAGKGGGSGGSSTTYTYFVHLEMGLCSGPIVDVPRVWINKSIHTPGYLGFSILTGEHNQAPWSRLAYSSSFLGLSYPGIAYAAVTDYPLGDSADVPNHNFEVMGLFSNSVPGSVDADPSLVVPFLLSDPWEGDGFPSARIGDLTTYQNYTLAAGLLLSFSLSDQVTAASVLEDIATATNSAFVFSEGILNIVPYGDEEITGNGKTYTPPAAPLYDLGDDDFVVVSAGDDPVQLTRGRQSDANNCVQLSFSNRAIDYDQDIADKRNQASIDAYGLRIDNGASTHLFGDATAANLSAQLQLQRDTIRNQYAITLDSRYVLLDPMDIVTITDLGMGLDHQPVRIIDITENDDFSLSMTVEEYLAGVGHSPVYSYQDGSGFIPEYNVDPGNANVPVFIDAPVEIATTGLEVWMAVSGGAEWGGAKVYLSSDGDTYSLAGSVGAPARQGVLTALLRSGSDPDISNTLSVDLSESDGQLISATTADADLANTLCYVDGELISFATATLTGSNAYDLTYLRRGLYGTSISSHASGTQFARLDDAIFKYSYDENQIGQTIYVKLLSQNIYGAAEQTLADVSAYTHVIQGPPVPSEVTNFLVAQNGNSVNFTWTQVPDYALKGYDIGYAEQGTTDWHEFTLLTEASKGTEMTNAAVPAGTWTFGIRARDIADQLSPITTFDLVILNNNDTTTIQVQEPDFAGAMSGFVRHWTGVLIPESTSLANAYSDYTIFNNFVTDPVASASYVTPTFDIGFEDGLRIHTTYSLTEGPGQSGTPTADIQLDAWTTGSDPGTYVDWTVGTIDVRYLNMKIIYDPTAGAVAYLTDFTYTVDRSPVLEQSEAVTIAPGGTAVTFDSPFHDIPTVIPTAISGSALYATASAISTTGCTINIWNAAGTSVGGMCAYSAKGI